MELRRNTKPIKCSKCGKECGPGEGWAHKTAHGWVALCEEHKPRDIMAELAAVDGIVNLKGKQYVLYKGLLVLAKNTGNVDIEVELIHYDMEKKRAVCKASVKGPLGYAVDYGDATQENCGKMVASAYIRMASTRAKARALRDYLGCGATAMEELPGGAS